MYFSGNSNCQSEKVNAISIIKFYHLTYMYKESVLWLLLLCKTCLFCFLFVCFFCLSCQFHPILIKSNTSYEFVWHTSNCFVNKFCNDTIGDFFAVSKPNFEGCDSWSKAGMLSTVNNAISYNLQVQNIKL